MSKVTVSSYDLRAVLSLLRVYLKLEDPAGHFKDPDGKLPDATYFGAMKKLEDALIAQDPDHEPFEYRPPAKK